MDCRFCDYSLSLSNTDTFQRSVKFSGIPQQTTLSISVWYCYHHYTVHATYCSKTACRSLESEYTSPLKIVLHINKWLFFHSLQTHWIVSREFFLLCFYTILGKTIHLGLPCIFTWVIFRLLEMRCLCFYILNNSFMSCFSTRFYAKI